MDQTPSIAALILALPCELFAIIMLLIDKHSELSHAKTCKALYEHYEKYYEKKTAVIIYDPLGKYLDYTENIKAFQLHHGWLRLKFASISDSQSSNCPVKVLHLRKECKGLEKLDYVCINALIMEPFFENATFQSVSFLEKFSNLRSLSLNTILKDDMILTFSKLPILEFISLYRCKMITDHLQKIFEHCTTLQGIQLIFCEFPSMISIKLHSQLKIFKISSIQKYKLNASDCTQLGSL
jgi:hypothetical protein